MASREGSGRVTFGSNLDCGSLLPLSCSQAPAGILVVHDDGPVRRLPRASRLADESCSRLQHSRVLRNSFRLLPPISLPGD